MFEGLGYIRRDFHISIRGYTQRTHIRDFTGCHSVCTSSSRTTFVPDMTPDGSSYPDAMNGTSPSKENNKHI